MHTSTSTTASTPLQMSLVSPTTGFEAVHNVEQKQPSSPLASFIRWVQLKNYQYEVTFSLYMLTWREKVIFNFLLFTLISMVITAVFFYLPNHVSIIYNRVWYYVKGSHVSTSFVDAVRTTKAALSYQTTGAATQHVEL